MSDESQQPADPADTGYRLVAYEEKVVAVDFGSIVDAVFAAPPEQRQAAFEQALQQAHADGEVLFHLKAEIDPPPAAGPAPRSEKPPPPPRR